MQSRSSGDNDGPIHRLCMVSGKVLWSLRRRQRPLDFRGWWRQVPRRTGGLKILPAVGAVAKGLVFGVAAAAQTDNGTSAEAEGIAVDIGDDEVAFDADGAVGVDGNFRWHCVFSMLTNAARRLQRACAVAARLY